MWLNQSDLCWISEPDAHTTTVLGDKFYSDVFKRLFDAQKCTLAQLLTPF